MNSRALFDKTIVVALGGNALIERHHPPDAVPQIVNVQRAIDALAPLAADYGLVITHGNGPQVGLLALESAADHTLARPYPLDALVAETQGLIGYWLLQSIDNTFVGRTVLAVVTRVLVDADDPDFVHPTKFIGPSYTEVEAGGLAASRGWTVRQDGRDWRRVVASPLPQAIVEVDHIVRALHDGTVVICGGGGGIPVVRNAQNHLVGIEAVVDKDLSSATIAAAVQADILLLLTDVEAVSTNVEDPNAELIRRATPESLRARQFPAGSMGPKVSACCQFVEQTGGIAAIGALGDVQAILAGTAGTIVTTTGTYPELRQKQPVA